MPAIKLNARFRSLPTIMAFVTAVAATTWLLLSAKAEYERDLSLGERQTELLAIGLQDTAERQFNEINSEIVATYQALVRQISAGHPTSASLREEVLRVLDDDEDILRLVATVNDFKTLDLSLTQRDTGAVDLGSLAWSQTATSFSFGFVNIAAPVQLPDGSFAVPMRYDFIVPAGSHPISIVALTDALKVLHSYEAVELADGSAFALFRVDGILLARWPQMAPYLGRKFNGPIFGDHLKHSPNGTIRAVVATDDADRILTYRTVNNWPLVVVAGVPIRGLLASWFASLPGKSLLLLFILSAIFLLWAALRSSQSQLLRSVGQVTEGEGRYARLLANIPGGVFTRRFVPPDQIEYTFASEGFNDTFGAPGDTRSPDTDRMLHLVHPEDRERMKQSILASREGDNVWTQEFRALKPNGQLMWVQSVARRYEGENGEILWDGVAIDVTDLRQHQALLENVQKIAGLGYWIWEPTPGNDSTDQLRRYTHYSPACAAILGVRQEDLNVTDAEFLARFVHPEDRERVIREYQHFLDIEDAAHDIQYRILQPGGGVRWVHCTATKDVLAGKVVRIIGVIQDITESKQREAELAQAQKMDAVGGLTGGVAHDFNNLLTVIIGNLEALLGRVKTDTVANDLARAALGAADRGATLTRRLLAFARRQPLTPRPTDLPHLLNDLMPLLKRSAGALIDVDVVAAPDLPRALVDPHQLENAVINLANNARDAMPRGGKLTIRVDQAPPPIEDGDGEPAEAGPYLRISVTDTGIGMSRETLARAVEPFFTTKPVGQGTGLGLSMVYGLAKQSKGQLRLYSEPGIGTTVRLYLPVATEFGGAAAAVPLRDGDFAGRYALLVDDDPPVRATTAAILRSLGFEVAEAQTGKEALRMLEGGRPIDVLVTDVILAGGMLGPEVASRAREVRPQIKVLFISGFASDALAEHRPLLSKPFRRAELAAELGKLLRNGNENENAASA